ncbi:hypothetical protein AO068_12730 [Pseudomonas sp. ICMP 3272]|uniref:Uncharacterized protein n=1 Tax=Pseudomonas savastanoi TaxID=29438 RepID=A0AAW3LXJ8_PSESS|nr:hypothetical protein AO068_12730 [Pseudomonas sp. ICMP 3272]KTC51275.1 hypothetical protein AO258_13500 [Pseudomonas syringae ICMP 19498]KTC58089.1 hypothetical protein AO287_11595 [Pseudomonas savastanoi]
MNYLRKEYLPFLVTRVGHSSVTENRRQLNNFDRLLAERLQGKLLLVLTKSSQVRALPMVVLKCPREEVDALAKELVECITSSDPLACRRRVQDEYQTLNDGKTGAGLQGCNASRETLKKTS